MFGIQKWLIKVLFLYLPLKLFFIFSTTLLKICHLELPTNQPFKKTTFKMC